MVQHFRDRIAPVSWQLLLSTLYSFSYELPLNENDRRIQLVSPWISDVENRHNRLSLPIRETIANEVGKDLSNLGQVLIALVEAGARVELLTHPLDGDWKKDKSAAYKQRERTFVKLLSKNGVNVRFHRSNHSKSITTPIGVLSGSANITDNGFYNNTERMTLTMRNESGFDSARTTTWDIWYEGYSVTV